MSSSYATDAYIPRGERTTPLLVDRNGLPLQGQVPLSITTVTATGAMPTRCPDVVRISSAGAVTLTAASLANLVGREITFCNDGVNTPAHIIQFPANSIAGANSRGTFTAAQAGAHLTVKVVSLTQVIVVASSQVTIS